MTELLKKQSARGARPSKEVGLLSVLVKEGTMLFWKSRIYVFAVAVFLLVGYGPSVAIGAGKQVLEELIAKAQKESRLNAMLNSNAPKSARKLVKAFVKRFGLSKLEVKLDSSGRETRKFQKALAETQAGAPPTFDAMTAEEGNVLRLLEGGGAYRVQNWQLLLREINPLAGSGAVAPKVVSPYPFSGVGFIYANRITGLIYNTNLVKSDADLPKRFIDLADSKYKGKLGLSQFISAWQYGLLFYDKKQLLDIADKTGNNAAGVLFPAAITSRMILGEFVLTPNNVHYYFIAKGKDPKAPIGVRFFSDYTPLRQLTYVVRKGAKSPASATLFALWMTTSEARSIRAAEDFAANVRYGTSEIDGSQRQLIQKSGGNLVSWVDSPQNVELLKWFATKEGVKYSKKLARAITQRK